MDATQEMDDDIANGDERSGDGAQGAGISQG